MVKGKEKNKPSYDKSMNVLWHTMKINAYTI